MELESTCHRSPMIELVRHLPLVCLVRHFLVFSVFIRQRLLTKFFLFDGYQGFACSAILAFLGINGQEGLYLLEKARLQVGHKNWKPPMGVCTVLFQKVLDNCQTTSGHDAKDKDFYVSNLFIHLCWVLSAFKWHSHRRVEQKLADILQNLLLSSWTLHLEADT